MTSRNACPKNFQGLEALPQLQRRIHSCIHRLCTGAPTTRLSRNPTDRVPHVRYRGRPRPSRTEQRRIAQIWLPRISPSNEPMGSTYTIAPHPMSRHKPGESWVALRRHESARPWRCSSVSSICFRNLTLISARCGRALGASPASRDWLLDHHG